ncbi:polysaccharide deacetylase family protein [Sabulibacter ruber]|uniref:polysaccharide deacetylase family protein n=1 Tax=Sabulibacter ruber TaxID=2811901 RepID=UPI001A979981|nr:polysaccharide deacetylase family protein [Sabulibacter ruber]
MKTQLRYIYRRLFENKAMVLMYHRIAEPTSDIWEIAVSPAHFEAQLQILKRVGTVVPLRELAEGVKNKRLKNNHIAITFDDGYADNYLTAKPILEKHGLPATFFVSTGNIGKEKEFWWDELERLLLYSAVLPAKLEIKVGNTLVSGALEEEVELSGDSEKTHQKWNACLETPPTGRAHLFFQLWQALKPLPYPQQEASLQIIREWAGNTAPYSRPDFISMSTQQLRELASHELFDIGAHTVNHPALAYHPKTHQEQEIAQNKKDLQKLTGQTIDLLAYPYGNFNEGTVKVAEGLEFKAAVTTETQVITKDSDPYRLGRVQVPNWAPEQFKFQLKKAWGLVN